MEENHKPEEFLSILAKCLQSLCLKYLHFDGSVLVTGQLHFSVDEASRDYVVNERVCKTTEGSTLLISSTCCSPLDVGPVVEGKQEFAQEANEFTVDIQQGSKLSLEPAPPDGGGDAAPAAVATLLAPPLPCTESAAEASEMEHGAFIDHIMKTEEPTAAATETSQQSADEVIPPPPEPTAFPKETSPLPITSDEAFQSTSNEATKPSYSCAVCGIECSDCDSLQKHIWTHAQIKPFVCSVCCSGFDSELKLKQHSKLHKQKHNLTCDKCGKKFLKKSNYTRHMHMHEGFKPYVCDFEGCKSAFAEKSKLNEHKERRHEGVKAFACDLCSVVYADPSSLKRHKQRKHGIWNPVVVKARAKSPDGDEEESVQLPDDDGDHENETLTTSLPESSNSQEDPDFSIAIATAEALIKKENTKGTAKIKTTTRSTTKVAQSKGKKPYVCEFCSKVFKQICELKTHRRTHTGERPFVCEVCGKGFAQKSNLMHHSSIHSGHRPWECVDCGKKFEKSSALTRHRVSHSAERPFVCETCGTAFKLKTHILRHWKNQICSRTITKKVKKVEDLGGKIDPQVQKEELGIVMSSATSVLQDLA